ncbi:MAG: VOC family protein [Alphaproteobacteria bacterium]
MIGYTTLGANDLPKAVSFYEKLLAPLGPQKIMDDGRMIIFAGGNGAMLGVCTPDNGAVATSGNGTMVALAAASKEQVDELYKLALDLGGTDEGAPGARTEAFYGAYCRDLDGNKLCFFFMG